MVLKKQDEEEAKVDENTNNNPGCEPCKQVRFAFGPSGQYFFALNEGGNFQYNACLNADIAKHVTEISFGSKFYAAAIAPDGGVFVACASSDDSPVFMQAGPRGNTSAFELAYRRLFDRLSTKHSASLEALSHVNLTLGPNGSYFSNTKDGPIWRDLPIGLETEIEDWGKDGTTPRQVALGRKGSYICLWSNDRWSYNLNGDFKGLKAKFDKYKESGDKIAFVALDPYESDSWIMVDCDGLISTSIFNRSTESIDKIQEMVVGYMQRRARKTGVTFTNDYSRTSSMRDILFGRSSTSASQSITITPDTKYDEMPKPMASRMLDPLRNFKTELLLGPAWKPTIMAAGLAGGSTAVICRLLKLPSINAATIAGSITACYVWGYAQGRQMTSSIT